jgi:hypothetical protein
MIPSVLLLVLVVLVALVVLVSLARSADPTEETLTPVPLPSSPAASQVRNGTPAPWTLVIDTEATRRRIGPWPRQDLGPSTAPPESAAGYYARFGTICDRKSLPQDGILDIGGTT